MKDLTIFCFPLHTKYVGNFCFTSHRPKYVCLLKLQDHLYFWKECTSVFELLYEDTHQEKIESKTTAVGWLWSDVPKPIQTCLDLSCVILLGPGVVCLH